MHLYQNNVGSLALIGQMMIILFDIVALGVAQDLRLVMYYSSMLCL